MSKEFLCRYLVDDEFCIWRTVKESTKEPNKAEAAGDEYEYELDWCTPSHAVVVVLGSILSQKDSIVKEQLQCDRYESREGKTFHWIV